MNKRIIGILLFIILVLLVPLIAMQFTDEVKWGPMDFLIMGVLLLSTGIGCELAIRRVKEFRYRIPICLAILAAFFIIWLELAVGIF
jgi:hypothetical protein